MPSEAPKHRMAASRRQSGLIRQQAPDGIDIDIRYFEALIGAARGTPFFKECRTSFALKNAYATENAAI